jgi:L-fuconolactonase
MAPLSRSIIDSHVHFWHPDKVHVPWVKGNRQFDKHKDAIDYSDQIKKARVEKAIYVETDVDQYHGLVEADWIYHYAKDEIVPNEIFGGIGGIVAFAPVHRGDHVQGYLRTLMRLTGGGTCGGLVKGVRYLIQDPNLDPTRILQPNFIRGIQCLELFNLSFDLNINCNSSPEQFPPLQELVTQCPRVQFVLDHMGKPPCDSQPGDNRFDFWKQQIILLASNSNVACKISGLVTELSIFSIDNCSNDDDGCSSFDRVVQQLKPFVIVAKEAFGIDRIMYGGDWPVCELANNMSWQTWLNILSEIIKDWSEDEKEKLFVTNATFIYKLNHKD